VHYRQLGTTGLNVSELCFGSLSVGPAQYNLTSRAAQGVLDFAWDLGVRFYDTAELYGTYGLLKDIAAREGAIIASRSFAFDSRGMRESLDRARKELSRDRIEIFGLHEQESGLTLKGHRDALEYLVRQREKGVIQAIAVSTHYVDCVRAAAMLDEVDVIFAILNVAGLGIRGGSRTDMENALRFAREMGKGVYIMKALGGGHLYREARKALEYARDFPHKDSVAVGLHTRSEVEFAVRVFSGERTSTESASEGESKRRLIVEDWCEGCGECVKVCGFGALTLSDGTAQVDTSKCMLCGYCARVCPHFCLKVV
jgi:predicted aldo/keto reductase-like oxidoreductase